MECSSCGTIKWLEHAVKLTDCMSKRRIRKKAKVDFMQFGFWPGKGATDAIFLEVDTWT